MLSNRQQAAIKALGKIENYKTDLKMLLASMENAPMWRPGAALKKQCEEALDIITEMEKRFDRKLVVTIIGPCGAGKSTLLNALSGVDDLSETGTRRPTTHNLIIFGREKSDAGQFIEELGSENVHIRSSRSAEALEHVLLIDTPDTDSTEQEKHIPLVHRAIALSDILICLFNSENPKRKDTVDFLAPYVKRFTGESLVCVMNKCDRQNEKELREIILPEFSTYIKSAFERPVDKIFCISARNHLHDPGWSEKAGPKHEFDQFEDLKAMIFGQFNNPGYIIDRRLENAESLKSYIFEELRSEIKKDRDHLVKANKEMKETEKRAVKESLSAIKNSDNHHLVGINVLLYQKIAQKWFGPVGWLIAVWARILIFGTGMLSMFRFGNPIRQIIGIASSLWHFKESRAAVSETGKQERVDAALRNYKLVLMEEWPGIAESLVRGRFENAVRKIDDILPDSETLSKELSAIWSDALDTIIEDASQNLSGIFLQFIFNIPVIAILVYVGWITTSTFLLGKYFTTDFFLHAILTITVILFLCFFVFQACVRLAAGAERITTKAFEKVKNKAEQFQSLSLNPVGEQIETVLRLNRGSDV